MLVNLGVGKTMRIVENFKKGLKRLGLSQADISADKRAMTGVADSEFAHPSVGLTPRKLHELLTNAETGDIGAMLALFEDMEEKDTHIFAEMDKRKRSIVKLDWYVTPPEEATAQEKEQAKSIQTLLSAIEDWDDVVKDALDAIGKGFSGQEIQWVRDGNGWYIEKLNFELPQRFVIGADKRTLMLANGMDAPEPLWENKWLIHTHKAKSGYLVRGGLHRVLAFPYVFKNFSVRDLAEFLEIYGLPLRLGTYPSGATDDEKYTLLKAVMQIGHRAAGIIPQGMQIDFKDAAKGSSDPFLAMINWCELSQSKAILGGTLTSQADGKTSTNALGNVHEDARQEICDSDAKQLATSINRGLIAPLMRITFPNVDKRRYPKIVFDTSEPEDILIFAEALPKLAGIDGLRIGSEWVHETLKIPMAGEDEAIIKGDAWQKGKARATEPTQTSLKQAVLSGDGSTPPNSTLSAERKANAVEIAHAQKREAFDKAVNEYEEQAVAELSGVTEAFATALQNQLSEFDSYEQAMAWLSQSMPEVLTDETQKAVLKQMMFMASAEGALAVLDGREED